MLKSAESFPMGCIGNGLVNRIQPPYVDSQISKCTNIAVKLKFGDARVSKR